MWNNLFQNNLSELISEFKMPVYFFIGKYDYNTPFQLSEEFFNQIKAPRKEYIWFENSVHMPNFEEPQKTKDGSIIIDEDGAMVIKLISIYRW